MIFPISETVNNDDVVDFPEEIEYTLEANAHDPRWNNSLFKELKFMQTKEKGTKMEILYQTLMEGDGHLVEKAPITHYDRIVNGVKVEIKGSTITKGSNNKFTFCQIRPDQEYDFLVFMTFWFDNTVMMHTIPKEDVLKFIKDKTFTKQHGGKSGKSGTFMYNKSIDRFAKYLTYHTKFEGKLP
jgi:hypothetical protein